MSNFKKKPLKKTSYLLFCESCGVPKEIPPHILKTYFVTEVEGVFCENCEHKTIIPDYLKKIAGEI